MKNLSAYLLLILGGNKNPSGDDVKKVLASAGLSVDQDAIDKLLSEVKGKDIWDLIESGRTKLAVSGGAPRAAAAAGGSSAAPASNAAAKDEDKAPAKDAKKDDSEESEGVRFSFLKIAIRTKHLQTSLGYGIWSLRLKFLSLKININIIPFILFFNLNSSTFFVFVKMFLDFDKFWRSVHKVTVIAKFL